MTSPRQVRKFKRYMAQKIAKHQKEKLKEILKPRPRFMPRWIWQFLIKMLLDIE